MSQNAKALDNPFNKVFRTRNAKGTFGIELEIEGTLVPARDVGYWSSKGEGSLRQQPHGFEYVLNRPVLREELDAALKELDEYLSKSKLSPSIRCSTHIHVNIQRHTIREIYNVLAYYYLIEDLLVRTQGPLREGNLFCLRMSDAEGVARELIESVKSEGYFGNFGMGTNKYGALNLASPCRFGSLEFRFFRPMSTRDIHTWCVLLDNLVTNASKLPIVSTLAAVYELNLTDFLGLVFDKSQIELLVRNSYIDKELVLKNYDHIFNLNYWMGRKKYIKVIDPTNNDLTAIDDEFDPTMPLQAPTINTLWGNLQAAEIHIEE